MELPFHLKALPPEALDVLRFYGTIEDPVARAVEITDGVGLSDRTFGKVIRRLVTKGYLQMDGDQAYRLSDQGQEAVDTLVEFDGAIPMTKSEPKKVATETVSRRLVLVAPRSFVAGSPTDLQVGFHSATSGQNLKGTADVVLRVSVINGEPKRPQEAGFSLDDQAIHRTFKITPGNFKRLRIRVQAFQLGPNPTDIVVAGGLYLDADVVASGAGAAAAYGVNVMLSQPE